MGKLAIGLTVGFMCGMRWSCMDKHINLRKVRRKWMRRLGV